MRKLRTAIIGFGKMGKIRYRAMLKHTGYEIVGLCDIHAENLAGCQEPVFSDWRSCLEYCRPEAVVVCTFNNMIPQIVCYALSRKIHVFSEKPPGRCLEDVMQMKTVWEQHPGLKLKFGFNHRYHNSVMEAKALIDSKMLGEAVCARGVYGKAGSAEFAREWRNDIGLSGGGILIDQGIHMIDLLCYLIGDFTKIQSSSSQLVWKELHTEDSVFAIMETDKGQMASLHSSAIQWKHKFDLDIICTNGYIALNGIRTSTKSYGEECISYYRKDLHAKNGNLGEPIEHTFCFDTDESWDYEMREFYDCVVNDEKVRNGSIGDAYRVMDIIAKIYSDQADGEEKN